jgi:hypothetical protein
LIGFNDGILRLQERHYNLQRAATASAIKLNARTTQEASLTRDDPANYCAAALSRGQSRSNDCTLPANQVNRALHWALFVALFIVPLYPCF